MNIWTGDGFKDIPADRMGPRQRYQESLDEILSEPYNFDEVKPCVESKVFGIGVEAYTAGSAEFTLLYAALLMFFPEIALHITRGVRWDSDHVVLLDDETKEICKEIVRCGGLEGKVHIALDYFDASINRVAAWTAGFRNVEKALLYALLTPHADLKRLQDQEKFTQLLVQQEELKTMPFGEVWKAYCDDRGVPADGAWMAEVERYENSVLRKRV